MAETYTVDSKGRSVIDHDPEATLDYPFDWTDWLEPINDTITSVVFSADNGATIEPESSHSDTVATAWVTGGTVNATVRVECKITTAGGRVDERSVYLKVKER